MIIFLIQFSPPVGCKNRFPSSLLDFCFRVVDGGRVSAVPKFAPVAKREHAPFVEGSTAADGGARIYHMGGATDRP